MAAPRKGGPPKTPEEQLSRALAKTLRHAAKAQGIPQDRAGWCRVADLVVQPQYAKLGTTPERIAAVVAADKKGRYELSDDGAKIRAVQGHSADVEVDMRQITVEADLPPTVVHGTSLEAWEHIRTQGLKRMSRQHIHMAQGLPGADGVRSGMRSSSQVHIYIDAPRALRDGIAFYIATNGAVLSPGSDGVIAPIYFARVTDAKGVDLD